MRNLLSHWPARLVLVLLVVGLLTTYHSSLTVQPAQGATTLLTKHWEGQTFTFTQFPFYDVSQSAGVTIYYDRSTGKPVRASVNWVDCQWHGYGIIVDKTWCGYVKVNRTTIDFGMNINKTALGPLPLTQMCWFRQHAQARYSYSDSRRLYFPMEGPIAEPWEPRHGCN